MNMEFKRKIELELNSGKVVELQMTQLMIDKIKDTFKLESEIEITSAHIRDFLISGMKNAIESSKDEKSSH